MGFLAPKLASKADIPCAGFTKYSLLLCVLLQSVFENVKLVSQGMVISVNKTWYKLLFNHTALMPKCGRPALSSLLQTSVRMTSPRAVLVFMYCEQLCYQAGKRMDFFIDLCQNQSF